MTRSRSVIGFLAAGFVVLAAPWARAQMVGLPVMDTAEGREQGSLEATPGVAFGRDMNFIGGRATVTAMDDLRAFVDLGLSDPKDSGSGLGLQAGALYCLPKSDMAEWGVRGAVYYANTDRLDLLGTDVMLVFSGETVLDSLYCYGGGGLDFCDKTKPGGSGSYELNPALSLGLSYFFTENYSLFTEADFVDGLYFGIGLSIR